MMRTVGPLLRLGYCMNHPWLTTKDWPFIALDGSAAQNRVASTMSTSVANSPFADDLLLGNAQSLCLLGNLIVHEWRAHKAGADHVGTYAVLGSPWTPDLSEPDQSVLHRRVSEFQGRCFLRVDRAQIGDARPATHPVHVREAG